MFGSVLLSFRNFLFLFLLVPFLFSLLFFLLLVFLLLVVFLLLLFLLSVLLFLDWFSSDGREVLPEGQLQFDDFLWTLLLLRRSFETQRFVF